MYNILYKLYPHSADMHQDNQIQTAPVQATTLWQQRVTFSLCCHIHQTFTSNLVTRHMLNLSLTDSILRNTKHGLQSLMIPFHSDLNHILFCLLIYISPHFVGHREINNLWDQFDSYIILLYQYPNFIFIIASDSNIYIGWSNTFLQAYTP